MIARAKKIFFVTAAVWIISGVLTLPAIADNYVGKITLVQVTTQGTRFYVRAQRLSLYAKGEYRDVLVEGFYTKSNFSIGYTPMTCPGGITGKCGKVNFVSVDVSNF
jgi:ABC-type long-subunit fatty acid transport system fused permease/ATPase subunit